MDTEGYPDEPRVTLHQDSLDDLMAVARLTRRDHRDVLADAVEALRAKVEPKLNPPAVKPRKTSKAAS